MEIIIYHNPRCSKSRQTLELIRQRDIEPVVIEYLQNPPTHLQLDSILRGLDMQPRDLIRKGEDAYKEMGLADESLGRDQLIDAMIKSPKLIERPIVVAGDEIVIGRPPELVLDILP